MLRVHEGRLILMLGIFLITGIFVGCDRHPDIAAPAPPATATATATVTAPTSTPTQALFYKAPGYDGPGPIIPRYFTSTPTPVCGIVWNNFDNGGWSGAAPFTPPSYLTGGFKGPHGSTENFTINTNPDASVGGLSSPNGLEISGNFVSGDYLETLTENGVNYGGTLDVSAVAGPAMKLSMMVYASEPTTITNIYIWDSAGNDAEYPAFNQLVPAGIWTNVVVPIGNDLKLGQSVTAPWTMNSLAWMNAGGIDFTKVLACGFDFTTIPGAYDVYIDNQYFMCQ